MQHYLPSRSLLLTLLSLLLWTNTALADCNTPRAIRTAQAGNYNTAATWQGGVVPTPCDFVIIDHAVTLDVSLTVGQNGNGGLVINSTGSLMGGQNENITLTGSSSYALTNHGTLRVNTVSFGGPGATFTNHGTATLTSTNGQNWNTGSYVTNRGTMTVTGGISQTSGMFDNDAQFATLTVGGKIELNGTTRWDNTGRIVSNSTDAQFGFEVRGTSTFYNRPTGRLKMLSGGLYQYGGTAIYNENYMGLRTLDVHDGSILQNTDSIMVSGNLINGVLFNNYAGAYISVGGDYSQINKSNSIMSNDGFVQITGNFTNDKTIGGNGGGYTVGGTSTNTANGQVTGTSDFCDRSVTGNNANGRVNIFDLNQNSSQATNYGVSTTTTRCAYVAPLASLKSANISGDATLCAGSTGKVYSIPAVSGATQYIWTVPAGYSITAVSPTGSISGSTATVNTTQTSGTISVTISASSATGVSALTVKTLNSTGGYNFTTKLLTTTSSTATLAQPGAILGPNSVTCTNPGGFVYSIAEVANADSYVWTVPTGWTINTGQGSTAISVTSNGTSGSVTVTAKSACATSATTSKSITGPGTVGTPTLSGPTSACASSTNTYTASAVTGASGYTWTVPAGWTIQTAATNGLYPASISVVASSTGGSVSVAAVNGSGCSGNSASQSVSITAAPSAPTFASTNTATKTNISAPCTSVSGYVYSIGSVTGATGYNWTVPAGWAVTSPAGVTSTSFTTTATSITVTPSTTSGSVSVTAANSCGTSSSTAFNVAPQSAAAPTITNGTSTFCFNTAYTFTASFTNSPGGAAAWTVPTGWSFTVTSTTSTTSTIQATASMTAASGNITATVTNTGGCTSSAATFAVTSGNVAVPGTISGPTLVSASSTGRVYSISAVANATRYNWSVPAGWVITSPTGAANNGTTLTGTTSLSITVTSGTADGTISVAAASASCTSATSNLAVRVDKAAVYTATNYSAAKKITCYSTNEQLLTAADPDAAINNATVTAGTLPAGLALATNGTISVSNPAAIVPGTSTFTVTTTDAAGGSTAHNLTLIFTADQAATATYAPEKALTSYVNGDVLVTYSDLDGAISSIALASGTLPPGTSLQISGTNGVLIVTNSSALTLGTYTFSVATTNSNCGIGQSTTSTTIPVGSTRPLPVELTGFAAQRQGSQVLLTWATAQEVRNQRFDVERSADGVSFTKLGEVAGNGTSATAHRYRFIDAAPLNRTAYYRLRQVDTDGAAHFSPVVTVASNGAAQVLSVELAPNPVQDVLRVQVTGTTGRNEVMVYTPSGQLLLQQATEGTATLSVQHLPAGLYLLKVRTAEGQTATRRFVRQ